MIESKLSLSTSLLLSLNGLIVVFSVLVILAFATIIIARIIRIAENGNAKAVPASAPVSPVSHAAAPAPAPAAAEENLSDVLAVLQGAVSLETGIPVDQFEIVSITSVTDSAQS